MPTARFDVTGKQALTTIQRTMKDVPTLRVVKVTPSGATVEMTYGEPHELFEAGRLFGVSSVFVTYANDTVTFPSL